MVTALLVSLADFSFWFSLLAVALGATLTLAVLARTIRDDFLVGGGISGVTRVSGATPRMAVDRAPLPVAALLCDASSATLDDGFHVSLSSRPPWQVSSVRVRIFAGVAVSALHHVLRAPWQWFLEAFERGGNIFGGDGCQQTGDVRNVDLDGEEPVRVHVGRPRPDRPLDLGSSAPRDRYPFVMVCVPSSEDISAPENAGGVGAVLTVFHVKDEACSMPTQVLYTHLKHLDSGRSTTLNPIFVSSVPVEEDTEEEEGEKRDTSAAAGGVSTRCIVCQDKRVTRVIFPCRHACCCGRCFQRLRSRCPMCRTWIHSFFLMDSEPESDEEEDGGDGLASARNRTWGEWLQEMNHNFAMRMGLQENN